MNPSDEHARHRHHLFRTASRRVSGQQLDGQRVQGLDADRLYARALLIMIVPMVVLQSVVTFVFMERHWNTVTRHLSAAVVQDIASLIDVYHTYPQDKDRAQLRRIAQQRLQLLVDFLPVGDMPPPGPNRSSRCSTRRSRWNSAARSASRSGSIPSAAPTRSKSASSSRTP